MSTGSEKFNFQTDSSNEIFNLIDRDKRFEPTGLNSVISSLLKIYISNCHDFALKI